MHIEESATHQFKYKVLPECAQPLQQEQMQAPEALENCQESCENSCNSTSTKTSLKMALANYDLGVWDWNLLTDSFNLANFDLPCSLASTKLQTHLILGYEFAEIPDYQSFERLIHPHDQLQVRQAWQNHFDNRTPICEIEFRILTKSADWKWIRESGRVIEYDASSQPIHIVGTHRDITKEKSLYNALNQHETREQLLKRVREIIDSSSPVPEILQAIVEEVRKFLDLDRVEIYSIYPNSDIFTATRTTSDSTKNIQPYVCGKADLVTPILPALYDSIGKACPKGLDLLPAIDNIHNIGNGANYWGMLIAGNCGGECKWQEWEIETFKQVSRELEIVIIKTQLIEKIKIEANIGKADQSQIQQISQQHERIQKQLLHSEKLASVGQLLTNLVNEIYNPVSFIDDTLYHVSQYAEDVIQILESYQQHYNLPPAAIVSKLENIDLSFVNNDLLKRLWSLHAASERLKETVFALHNFVHFDNGEMKKTDLHIGLNNALIILQHRLKEQPHKPKIQVIKDFGEIPLINCSQSELNQVFMNILTNAIEALEKRMEYDSSFAPKICISTKIVASHLSLVSKNENESQFVNEQPIPTKQKIIIRIFDNGTGILPHIKRRIFEPFFTTKPISGKGLGLSISEEIIVQNHHGKLRCNSKLGEGTEFIIEINSTAKSYANIRRPANF
jgi:two-component system, NtrC family, sensor kinase